MPFCVFQENGETVRIYYHTYSSLREGGFTGDHPKIVFVMGFAAPSVCWQPQITELLTLKSPDGSVLPVEVCVLDNRGIGRSSAPIGRAKYSTEIMAADVVRVMDLLQWSRFHIVGHSMGGMISMKVGAAAPHRVASLTVISSTGGGWQVIPWSFRAIKIALLSARAKSAEQRHKMSLKLHFRRRMLNEEDHSDVDRRAKKAILLQEYQTMSQYIGDQPPDAFKGQAYACWMHQITKDDIQRIRLGGFSCLVIHGRHDIVAHPRWGRLLAERMLCPFVLLEGAHFLTRDQAVAVNQLIKGIIYGSGFHHLPHYQFVLTDTHLPRSYTEGLDTSIDDLIGCPNGPQQKSGPHSTPSPNGMSTAVAITA